VRLADVNVLIYAHREESSEHREYARWLTELVEGDEPFGCSEIAASGFARIVTNPRIFSSPTPLATALRFIDQMHSRPNCVRLRPGPEHWAIFAKLCLATRASGKLMADAYHAALAIEHGCELATTDADFARFPGLRWRHPLHA